MRASYKSLVEKARRDFTRHIEEQHRVSPFSVYIKEIVFGANDGIITTFAVVAGFAGARGGDSMSSLPYVVVLLFGLANLFADAASMGLGEFLSMRASKDMYKAEKERERREIRRNPQAEKNETINILLLHGFSKTHADELVRIYSQNEAYWLDFMMGKELRMPDIEEENPLFTALFTFLSFIVFGFIPLIPYVILYGAPHVFLYSCLTTTGALVMVGVMRWKVTGLSLARSVSETLIVGGTAAAIAYGVGRLFSA